MTILLVDDEYYAMEAMHAMVASVGIHFSAILTAENYQSALEQFQNQKIDILITDIEMPNGSGLSLVEWTREYSPDTVCLFLTCHGEISFAQTAIRLGCLDYLLKPPEPEMIQSVLERAVKQVEKQNEQKAYAHFGKIYLNQYDVPANQKKTPLTEAVEYIQQHIREAFTVADVADAVATSADHLTRLFKKEFKKTVTEYITELRMNMAREMILQGQSLSTAAEYCGFLDYGYFGKVFKKHFGISPKEFQKQIFSKQE